MSVQMPLPSLKRSKFSLSHYNLLTAYMGNLVPVGVIPVLPGDTIRMNTHAFIRMSPMLAPIMHPIRVFIHHWYLPKRVIWDNIQESANGSTGYWYKENGTTRLKDPWETFITNIHPVSARSMHVGESTILPPWKSFAMGKIVDNSNTLELDPTHSLYDYFGMPYLEVPETWSNHQVNVSAELFAMYRIIWNNFYRDEDLQTELSIFGDSPTEYQDIFNRELTSDDIDTILSNPQSAFQYANPLAKVLNVAWDKDYFTTARPWAAKGAQVSIPMGNVVQGDNSYSATGSLANSVLNIKPVGASWTGDQPISLGGDLTVSDLRLAFALQRFQEMNAMFGSRYNEFLAAQFGVKNIDSRLQLPKYLGGSVNTLRTSEVLQTAQGSDPVGTMRGHGFGVASSNRFIEFIPEHGYIMTLMSVRPIPIYTQGFEREYLKKASVDFWNKALEGLSMQEVWQGELFAFDPSAIFDPNYAYKTFGYQGRYDEYRSKQNRVMGDFRRTLDFFHLARRFANPPVLNSDFISLDPVETMRIFADTTSAPLWCMVHNSVQARRLLSKVAIPKVL